MAMSLIPIVRFLCVGAKIFSFQQNISSEMLGKLFPLTFFFSLHCLHGSWLSFSFSYPASPQYLLPSPDSQWWSYFLFPGENRSNQKRTAAPLPAFLLLSLWAQPALLKPWWQLTPLETAPQLWPGARPLWPPPRASAQKFPHPLWASLISPSLWIIPISKL